LQAAWSVTVQDPFGRQQEPVGWTQVFGEQTPNIVQVPVHAVCSVTAQDPSG